MASPKSGLSTIPVSFAVGDIRPDIFPGTPSKLKHVIRQNKRELIAAGALVRVGRQLVIIGAPYHAWLMKHASNVENFDIPPNRARRSESRAA